MHANVPEVRRVARTARREREGILDGSGSEATNAMLKGVNSLIQPAKRAARGFRNTEYLRTAVFLRMGVLDFSTQLTAGCAIR